MTAPLTLLQSVDLLGRYRYVELAAFERLGRRAPECSHAGVATFLAQASLAHAWRARLFEERLPVSVGLPDAAASTRSPGSFLDEALDELVGPGEGAAGDPELLDALLGALYPSMLAGYASRLEVASPSADPPVVLALGRATADLERIAAAGLRLVRAGASGPPPPAARRDRVATMLDAGGGAFGPLLRRP